VISKFPTNYKEIYLNNEFRSLIFRFPNVIGSRLTHGVVFDFINKLKENGEELVVLGDGMQTKPYMHISDLISAIMMMMNIVDSGVSIYNIGVETKSDVTSIANVICEEMNLKDVKYSYAGGSIGWKGDVPSFEYCLDKIHSAGWGAKYTSDEAVRKTVKEVLGCKL
jgi:UDP-glucose 4-epimerase